MYASSSEEFPNNNDDSSDAGFCLSSPSMHLSGRRE